MRVAGVVVGAIMMFIAYPLYLFTDFAPAYHLMTSAGSGICFLALSDKTVLGRILNIVGTLQTGYFLLFIHRFLYPTIQIKIGTYTFIVILLLCLITLCFRLARKI